MVFDVAASSYDSFMGRWSRPLSAQFADFAGVTAGQTVLDVGSGTGALTAELVARLGPDQVTAIEPSASFVAAMHERFPRTHVLQGSAEKLPFPDDSFDAAVAQLVVHFMADPASGLREMARVTRSGGAVAANVWDYGTPRDPLRVFWAAAHELDAPGFDESGLAGTNEGQLAQLFEDAGMDGIEENELTVELDFPTFEDWWTPFEAGVGPSGQYFAALSERDKERIRELARAQLPDEPIRIKAVAWAVRGRA